MPNSRGYVLLTSLYLLALLSISSVAAVQTSVLMAQHTRLLDSQVRSGLDTSDRLNAVEAVLLRGETLAEPDVSETHAACDSRAGTWIRVRRLHSRALHLVDTEGVSHEAQVIIYGLQACADGRARTETSLSVLQPAVLSAEVSLPANLVLGRLSWRQVW